MAKKKVGQEEFKARSVNIKILTPDEWQIYLTLQSKAKLKGLTLHDKFFDMCRKEVQGK